MRISGLKNNPIAGFSISVLLPIRNEEFYVRETIESIIRNNVFNNSMELIIIDGDSSDFSAVVVNKVMQENPHVAMRLLFNPERSVSSSMNLAIAQAKGEFIVRIDAHSVYPSGYLNNLVGFMIEHEADNVGGCVVAKPADKSIKSLAIAIGLSKPFAIGNSAFRYVKDTPPMEVDTVPFGCYRKEIFSKIGMYDVDLVRNQDDELNARLRQANGRIILIPDIRIDYYARDKYKNLFSMFYQYGYFKPLVNKKIGKPATYRQFAPLVFVLFLVFGLPISLLFDTILAYYIAGILVYLLSSVTASYLAIRNRGFNVNLFLQVIATFFIIHFSYGVGYIMGIVDFMCLNKKTSQVPISR